MSVSSVEVSKFMSFRVMHESFLLLCQQWRVAQDGCKVHLAASASSVVHSSDRRRVADWFTGIQTVVDVVCTWVTRHDARLWIVWRCLRFFTVHRTLRIYDAPVSSQLTDGLSYSSSYWHELPGNGALTCRAFNFHEGARDLELRQPNHTPNMASHMRLWTDEQASLCEWYCNIQLVRLLALCHWQNCIPP